MISLPKTLLILTLLAGSVLAQGRAVSLNYTNADLVPVLKKLARDAGFNIFLSPEVQGSVTVSMKGQSATAALDLILSLQEDEYDYKILKNTIVVASPERLKEIPDDLFGR